MKIMNKRVGVFIGLAPVTFTTKLDIVTPIRSYTLQVIFLHFCRMNERGLSKHKKQLVCLKKKSNWPRPRPNDRVVTVSKLLTKNELLQLLHRIVASIIPQGEE